MFVLPDNAQRTIAIINGTARSSSGSRRYKRAIRNRPAMLEVRVNALARGARDEAAHGALDPVRAEHDVRLGCRPVGKVDRRCARGCLGEVCAALVEVRARGVDVRDEGLEEDRAVDALRDVVLCVVLIGSQRGEGEDGEIVSRRRALRCRPRRRHT